MLVYDTGLGAAVEPGLLAGDAMSDGPLSDYSSVDVHLNVTIDNKAWYPDLGYVAATNHDRLANILTSEGFTVVSSMCHSILVACTLLNA